MRVLALAIVFGTLAACAQPLQHTASVMDVDDAYAIIQQVAMEQPPKFRPAGVSFTDTYIAIHKGSVSRGSGVAVPVGGIAIASGNTVTNERNTLLYFDTVAGTRLHKKRDWYVLDVVDRDGRILERLYTRDESKAHRFIDAVNSLKRSG